MSRVRLSTTHRLRPVVGLTACGDSVVEVRDGHWHLVAVIDALGHGPDAERSARAAHKAVVASKGRELGMVFEAVHRALNGLRGAVMSALLVEESRVTFAGVGNVALFVPKGTSTPLTMAGTLGGFSYRYKSFPLTLAAGQRWGLATDGVRAREGSALFEAMKGEPAAALLDKLFAEATRSHDDVGVAVVDVEAA